LVRSPTLRSYYSPPTPSLTSHLRTVAYASHCTSPLTAGAVMWLEHSIYVFPYLFYLTSLYLVVLLHTHVVYRNKVLIEDEHLGIQLDSRVNTPLTLSPILPNLLRTIPSFNCLTIYSLMIDWNKLNPSLTSVFLYIMHLPNVNHIDLSFIQDFPLSSLTLSVNLHHDRLNIFNLLSSWR
jgi:hypothetical protein